MKSWSLFIDGRWVPGIRTEERKDRWTDEVWAETAVGTVDHARAAVDAATAAFGSDFPVPMRSAVLRRASELLSERSDAFATAIQRETGKPISAARVEVARAVGTLALAAEETLRLPGERVPLDAVEAGASTFAFTIPKGRGVVAAVTPFNFPVNLVVHKVGPAIAAGCPVVLKPSDKAAVAAFMLVEVFEDAGLPAGWLNLVNGPPEEIVGAWLDDDRVAVLTFTGSAEVGWQLKARSPRKLHILELGSNTAMYVHSSADLERAAADAVTAGFSNSGQACVSLQRLYVDAQVAKRFTELAGRALDLIGAGDPALESTMVGPLISDAAVDRVEALVGSAVGAGAGIVRGGAREGSVMQPTLLDSVVADDRILTEEVFGPVVSIVAVDGVDAAIAAVNRSRYGLNASIYASDLAAAMRFAERAEAGTVLVNMPPSFRADHMPYGGVKESGQGREGVRYAIAELLEQKLVVLKA